MTSITPAVQPSDAPVTLQLDPALVPRVKTLATDLPALDARLQAIPQDRLDDEDREEITRLRQMVHYYAATVLELVEPQAVIQDTIQAQPAFVQDLVGVMERFVTRTNDALNEAEATPATA